MCTDQYHTQGLKGLKQQQQFLTQTDPNLAKGTRKTPLKKAWHITKNKIKEGVSTGEEIQREIIPHGQHRVQ